MNNFYLVEGDNEELTKTTHQLKSKDKRRKTQPCVPTTSTTNHVKDFKFSNSTKEFMAIERGN